MNNNAHRLKPFPPWEVKEWTSHIKRKLSSVAVPVPDRQTDICLYPKWKSLDLGVNPAAHISAPTPALLGPDAWVRQSPSCWSAQGEFSDGPSPVHAAP